MYQKRTIYILLMEYVIGIYLANPGSALSKNIHNLDKKQYK